MANLMLTKQCNLRCSYCFANEFVNRQSDVMSYENFETCLNFLSHDPQERIGLIGGEPTMHPELKRMLARLIDSPFQQVCLFTNGILLDQFFTELRNSKFSILINLNAPGSIGQANFDRTLRNIDEMVNRLYMRSQVQLSLNVHSPDMDYQYMLETLRRFEMKRLRLSVAVPNMEAGREVDPLAYFRLMAGTIRRLVRDLLEIGVAPVFDCNYIPYCIFNEDDRALMRQFPEVMARSNIRRINPVCSPVLDILPDLQVVRCFGMSSLYKVPLLDFRNTEELQRHFNAEIDALAYNILPSQECKGCHEYIACRCSGGCYAYRLEKLRQLRQDLRNTWGALQ
ncbi:MAG: radical SAM protein [Clostridia bacterium]|nr:radical SAM protein [Clostridia bacterium]